MERRVRPPLHFSISIQRAQNNALPESRIFALSIARFPHTFSHSCHRVGLRKAAICIDQNPSLFGLSLPKPCFFSGMEEQPFDRLRTNGIGMKREQPISLSFITGRVAPLTLAERRTFAEP